MSTHCKASLPVLSHAMQRLQCCVIWKKILMVLMVGILRLRSGTFPNCKWSPPSDMPASSWNFISRTPPTSGCCKRPGATSPKETSQRSCAASTCRHVVLLLSRLAVEHCSFQQWQSFTFTRCELELLAHWLWPVAEPEIFPSGSHRGRSLLTWGWQ